MPQQKFKLDLSDYSVEEREAIALEVITFIQKRSKEGKDKDGEKFAPYSKAYKESLNFRIAGKSSKVDLVLSGDMLDSIEILNNYQNGKVEIGYQAGSTENGKAEGNILGTYGQDHKVGPERDFLGISERDLNSILKRYPPDTKKSERRAKEILLKQKESDRLSGAVDLEELDEE